MWWWRYMFDHPAHAVLALLLGVVIWYLVFNRRTSSGGTRDGLQDAEDEGQDGDDGAQARSAGSQQGGGAQAGGGTDVAPAAGSGVALPAVPSAEFDSEAATLVGDANRWFQTGRQPLTITIKGCAKLKVEARGSGTIGNVSIGFDGEQEFDVPASAELKFVGQVRIAFTGEGTVTVAVFGVARVRKGGSLHIKDNAEVTLTEGPLLEAADLPSVSASHLIGEGLCIMATGCESVFGREGMRLLAARCGTVYASNGDVFAYKCDKVHASHDAVVYAVRCKEVSATDRSRVCHLQCGSVRQSDKAVLEEHAVDR